MLADEDLHAFVGGRPGTEAELRERFARQVVGRSPDGRAGWLNWVLRDRGTQEAVGTAQATLIDEGDQRIGELAWVVAVPRQGHGYAGEAAAAVTAWLRGRGVARFRVHIHPAHAASQAVARRVGLAPTGIVVDGETRWQG